MAVMRGLVLLLLVFSLENAAAKRCSFGWTPFGHECYKFFTEEVNWAKAEKNCKMNDATLASVRSKVQNDFLQSLVSVETRAWIGGHDGEIEGEWLWSDGSPFDYTNWCPGEPDNNYQGNVENCLALNKNNCWSDQICKDSNAYICAQKQ